MNEWESYQDSPPIEAGTYMWRVKSKVVPDLFLIFSAQMRMRGNGYGPDVLSPSFDDWDGYRVKVPSCEWKMAPNISVEKHDYGHLSVEGLEFLPCPYCGETPKLKAYQYCSGGGFVVCPDPQNYNYFEIRCCSWGRSPTLKDPRDIEKIRREAFSRIKESV